MNIVTILVAGYGIFTLLGGVMGYLKAQSMASLVAGVITGLLLLICAPGVGRADLGAALVSATIALLLGGRFFGTWRQKRRVMPDLLMVVWSGVTLVIVGSVLLRR